MGIYDRDYYRREGPSFLGTLAEQGRVTNWLIGINIVCFIVQFLTRTTGAIVLGPDADPIQVLSRQPFTDALLLNVGKVLDGEVWRLLTYAFLHDTASIWHILFNMLFLFWFGRQVEDVIGSREYLWFYLVGAVVSGLAYVGAALMGFHRGPGGGYPSALGASGAVTAVLVMAALYNPRQVIYVFFVLPVPIWGFVIFMVAMDAFDLVGRADSRVATSAHLGGALFGFCYYKLGWRLSGWTRWFSGWRSRRVKPNLKLYREDEEEPTPKVVVRAPATGMTTPSPLRALDDEQLEAQVDSILEKIQRVGMDGLSDNERQVLMRASEVIKRRRG